MNNILSSATYMGNDPSGVAWDGTAGTPHEQVVLGGEALTLGQTYQVDIFALNNHTDPTLYQVVGASTYTDNVNVSTTPQIFEFDVTPDASGDITLNFGPGSGTDSGVISGVALTEIAAVPEPSAIALMSVGLCLLLGLGRLKRRLA